MERRRFILGLAAAMAALATASGAEAGGRGSRLGARGSRRILNRNGSSRLDLRISEDRARRALERQRIRDRARQRARERAASRVLAREQRRDRATVPSNYLRERLHPEIPAFGRIRPDPSHAAAVRRRVLGTPEAQLEPRGFRYLDERHFR